MQKSLTSYDILNISEDAPQADIHTAYRILAKKWHPDAHHNRTLHANRAHRNFTILQKAYETVKTPDARSDYNRKLARLRRAVRKSQNAALNDNSRLSHFMRALDSVFQFDGRKDGY